MDGRHNDEVLIRGEGFIQPGEGLLEAEFDGTFTNANGDAIPVNARTPVELAEPNARDRALVRLSTALGGIDAGRFEGTVRIHSELLNGAQASSEPLNTTFTLDPPVFFTLAPTTLSLGQLATVQGAGFLGLPTEPQELTAVRLEGTFSPDGEVAAAACTNNSTDGLPSSIRNVA